MSEYKRICAYCQKEFGGEYNKTRNKKYCSHKCSTDARIKLEADLVGQKFGLWEVTKFLGSIKESRTWEAKCSNCGIAKNCTTSELGRYKSNRSKSGNSSSCKNCYGHPKGQIGFNYLLDAYKRVSNMKGQEHKVFTLTDEEFRKLTSSNCIYCGSEPNRIKGSNSSNTWGDYHFNGLDRLDSAKGYSFENCVPCCWICNRAKRDMSHYEFLNYINRLVSFRHKKLIYQDERGTIENLLNGVKINSIVAIESVAESIRANHWHRQYGHHCYLLKGKLIYTERPCGSVEPPTKRLVLAGELWYTPPLVEHQMYFLEDSQMICLGEGDRDTLTYEGDTIKVSVNLKDVADVAEKERQEFYENL